MFFIENLNPDIIRGWQGHLIEKRWFTCVKGKVVICVKEIENFENSTINQYILDENSFETLYIPNGFAFTIQSLIDRTKIMVLSNYYFNETNDLFSHPIQIN
jgi:dTDP-4-dehydrorhamnose 3,5-epimerase